MKRILIALILALALPAQAQYAHRSNPGVIGGVAPTIAVLGACPGSGCATVNTSGASALLVTITASGSCPGANCTLQFACSKDNWATSVAIAADSMANGTMSGLPSTTTTVAGTFLMPTFAFPSCGVLASVYVSGTATVDLQSDPAFVPTLGATGGAALQAQGNSADQSAILGNPLVEGVGSGVPFTALAPRYCDKTAAVTTLGTTATVQQIALLAGANIYVCGYQILASTATATTTLQFKEGTGANCVTGTANVGGIVMNTPTAAPGAANLVMGPSNPAVRMTATAGDALCITQGQTTNATTLTGIIFYNQSP